MWYPCIKEQGLGDWLNIILLRTLGETEQEDASRFGVNVC